MSGDVVVQGASISGDDPERLREALDAAFKAPKTAEAEGTAEAKGGRHKPSREADEDEPNLRMVRDARAIFR